MSPAAYPTLVPALPSGPDVADTTSRSIKASRSRVDEHTVFDTHFHDEDQLAWMASGSMRLTVRGETWHLRRDHFAWIPAGVLHEMSFDGEGELLSAYLDPASRPGADRWRRPCVVGAGELACSLLQHVADAAPAAARTARCHAVLLDVLADAEVRHDVVALPHDPRAREVAATLLKNPADPRELSDWAAELGVSGKTIARAFAAPGFREWRIQARLHAAAGMLAQGDDVQHVATAVGYVTPSSFIAAFKTRFGTTPARYAAQGRYRRA